MTDDEIKNYMRYHYRGDPNGAMAGVVFKIACYVRDRVMTWTESDVILNLRERLDSAERKVTYLAKQLEEAELATQVSYYRDMYTRLRKIHREDVLRRLEMRRFRAANFSVAELEEALARKRAKPPLPKRASFVEFENYWRSLEHEPDGNDIFEGIYPVSGKE